MTKNNPIVHYDSSEAGSANASVNRKEGHALHTATAWPDDCWLDFAAERQRAEQVARAAEAWRKAWPRHCPACGGWGGSGFTEMHGFKGGSGEQLFDPCGALPDAATCHRCGQDGLTQDGEGSCTHCGWDYNDGEPQ